MITNWTLEGSNHDAVGVILNKKETLVSCRNCECVYVIHSDGIYDCPECGRRGTKFDPIYGDLHGDTGGADFIHSELEKKK